MSRWLLPPIAVAVLATVPAVVAARPDSRAARAAGACGVERWAVKTLTDDRARLVNFTPRGTSVRRLRGLPAPGALDRRIAGVETTTYRVRAKLVAAKLEDDEDIHLVIADPRDGGTMIAEFPNPSCTVGATAGARTKMASARSAFLSACGQPGTSSFRSLSGSATVAGVGFFDFKHGQRGVAPNAVELHPVVGFAGTCS